MKNSTLTKPRAKKAAPPVSITLDQGALRNLVETVPGAAQFMVEHLTTPTLDDIGRSMRSGAAQFVDLLHEIKALSQDEVLRAGYAPGEDGSMRFNYEGAEAALCRRLAADFGMDIRSDRSKGFVRAMSTYLIATLGGVDVELREDRSEDVEYLLHTYHEDVPDIGAMAPAQGRAAAAPSGDDSEARNTVACFAAGEIEVLIRLVRREWQRDDDGSRDQQEFGTLLNGWLARLEQLNSVILSVIGDDDARSTKAMDRVVFGMGV